MPERRQWKMVKIVMKMDEADKKSSLSIIGNWNSTGEIFRN